MIKYVDVRIKISGIGILNLEIGIFERLKKIQKLELKFIEELMFLGR